ncbi:hypothetical protein COCNU_01G011710 [Cocos nucifera]|uniref:Uncharacterized protein n=1 Tax=Cocos nucifera TaxID=13894 RepID=A0A8K0MUV7_COCNU|nr:hypothetical protein COCNU_01G011710 [Cocos nucifera]
MRARKLRPVRSAVKESEPCDCHPWKGIYDANKKMRRTENKEAPEPQVDGNTATEKDAAGTSVGKPKEHVKGKSKAAATKPQPQNTVQEAPAERGEVSASKAQ